MNDLYQQLVFLDSQIAEAAEEMTKVGEGSALHGYFQRKRDGLREVRSTIKKLGDAADALNALFKAL